MSTVETGHRVLEIASMDLLIGNAIKYIGAVSITLGVASALVDNGRVRLRMEVQDTRIGIAPEAQERVFDPFVQLSQPNARNGSGLRLANCRPLAQMMGGHPRESKPGEGSTFRVELFAEAAEESPTGAADR